MGLMIGALWITWLFVGLVLFAIGLMNLTLPPSTQELAVVATVSDRETFPVSLRLSRKGSVTGTDSGWVTFVDGWLVYEGLRTNFSLASDLPAPETVHGIRFILPDDQAVDLIYLKSSLKNPWALGKPIRLFKEAVRHWRTQPPPEGEPVLPPLKMHPDTAAERLKNLFAGAAMCLAAALILGALEFWIVSAACLLVSTLLFALFGRNLHQFHAEFDQSFSPPGIEGRIDG